MSVVSTNRMEEVLKWAKEKPWVRKELGEYESACQDFVQRVSQLDGVVTVGAIPYAGHVDLWTVVKKRNRSIIRTIIERLIEVSNEYDDVFFDFVVIDDPELLPEESIVIYKNNNVQSIPA